MLADLALESHAATVLAMRIARAVDRAGVDANEAAMARLGTALGKYWLCKRAPAFVNEAQECLGGAGYVEESMLPRLYRQAPLNSIWEGSGNIQCLDVLRALEREPGCADALFAELADARGGHPLLDAAVTRLRSELQEAGEAREAAARRITGRMAQALQAALLLRSGHAALAEAFCASRLSGAHDGTYGTLAAGAPRDLLLERAGH